MEYGEQKNDCDYENYHEEIKDYADDQVHRTDAVHLSNHCDPVISLELCHSPFELLELTRLARGRYYAIGL